MKRWGEGYALVCCAIGFFGFWGLIIYRLYREGYQWLYQSNDGIVIAGIIGICGYMCAILPPISERVMPLGEKFSDVGRLIAANTNALQEWMDERISVLEVEPDIRSMSTEVSMTNDRIGYLRDEIKDIQKTLDRLESRLDRIEFPLNR